jgi:hypothetical protein
MVAIPEQDPVESYQQLAQLLWTDATAKKIGTLILDLERVDTRPDLVRILATMPTTGARQSLQELFDKFQGDGPASFVNAGLLGQNLMDPAFLLVAKKAYHDKDSERPARRGRANDPYGGGAQATQDPWELEVESYVRFLSETLARGESPWAAEEAATPPEGAETAAADEAPASETGPLGSMPVRVHRGASVVAEYHARWPEHAASKLPGASVAPLEIHYVRIEGEERPSQLSNSYKRQAGRNAIVRDSEGGGWFDGYTEDAQTGARHSIDIRIYNDPAASGVNAQLRPNDPRPLIIEILTVTIPATASASDTEQPPTAEVGTTAASEEELPF